MQQNFVPEDEIRDVEAELVTEQEDAEEEEIVEIERETEEEDEDKGE